MSAHPASAYDPLVLLSIIREVAETSMAANPKVLSQREWDAARAGPYADAPSARRISEYLGLPWAKARDLAFTNGPGRARVLGRALGADAQDWLTPDYAAFALALIARRLGKNTLSRREYMREREALLGEDNAHWLHGRRLLLPSADQIDVVYSWDAALRSAGLRDSHSDEHGQRRTALPSIIDILDRSEPVKSIETLGRRI